MITCSVKKAYMRQILKDLRFYFNSTYFKTHFHNNIKNISTSIKFKNLANKYCDLKKIALTSHLTKSIDLFRVDVEILF